MQQLQLYMAPNGDDQGISYGVRAVFFSCFVARLTYEDVFQENAIPLSKRCEKIVVVCMCKLGFVSHGNTMNISGVARNFFGGGGHSYFMYVPRAFVQN